ncbi:uncharacterized protein L969DRAFT_90217 [Mixia osmundae IAM 14324]|nr:uncharacterized protein L969DRAFT_90217 [Mixia osmundae IAM 14324]KEI37152.1 hypothetical protein L969DRAFT_90217 [Mixia osmundae IAM 14324]
MSSPELQRSPVPEYTAVQLGHAGEESQDDSRELPRYDAGEYSRHGDGEDEKRAFLSPQMKRTGSHASSSASPPSSPGMTAPAPQSESTPWQVAAAVSFYILAALVMVMGNKWVLNSVNLPLYFLLVQLTTSVLLLRVSAIFGYFRVPTCTVGLCKGLAPLILVNVIGLAFNTYCLQAIDASFYQIARGMILPCTALFSYFYLNVRPNNYTLGAIGVVCFGFMLGVGTEDMSVSALGIVLGFFSSITTAYHAIVVKRSLPLLNNSSLDLVYFSNLLSAIILLPFAVVVETGDLLAMTSTGGSALSTFISGSFLTGIFGFLIGMAGTLSIKVTSPTTHMISSAVRGIAQTFLGCWLFNDQLTSGRASGIVAILAGSIMYTWSMSKKAAAPSATPVRSPPRQTAEEDRYVNRHSHKRSLSVTTANARKFYADSKH